MAVVVSLIAPTAHHHNLAASCGQQVTAKQSRAFVQRVWDRSRWGRGSPHPAALKAWRHKLKCAGPANRVAMHRYWQRQRRRYGRYRALRLIAPYPGNGEWWAIPYAIVYCESGTSGLWSAENPSGAEGPYQLLGHGQPWPVTSWHDKMAHHRIAAALSAAEGTAPWVASVGCGG